MKRSLFLSLLIAAVIATAPSFAQSQRYPEAVRTLFEKADAEVSELYAERGCEPKAEATVSLRIAVPSCPEQAYMMEMVRQAGCDAVAIPPMESLRKPYSELRSLAADWDGVFMQEGWVTAENEYSVLLYKAVSERNIPCIGASPLTRMIDESLRRMPSGNLSIEELVSKARTYHLDPGHPLRPSRGLSPGFRR